LSDKNRNTKLDYVKVVDRDLSDIKQSKIVLVDFRRGCNIIGTAMEMSYARMWGKKINIFCNAYQQHY